MKKAERIANLETAVYVLALTAARDESHKQDKEVLTKIRDYMDEIIKLKNGNTFNTVLATMGMSESEGLALTNDFDKE